MTKLHSTTVHHQQEPLRNSRKASENLMPENLLGTLTRKQFLKPCILNSPLPLPEAMRELKATGYMGVRVESEKVML